MGAITEASGELNEDGMGLLGLNENISAAWVFDGVTGINGRSYLPGGSDAAWLVGRANHHLLSLASNNADLPVILSVLVAKLIKDWDSASAHLQLPEDYDPPAACLVMAKRYASGWNVMRLGDALMLAQNEAAQIRSFEQSPNNAFDAWLSGEAQRRRNQGQYDVNALLAEFRPQLLASRKTRNTAESFGILKADPASTRNAEYLELGDLQHLLLCTDGFYRAVDHYHSYDDATLLSTCNKPEGVKVVLESVRRNERADPQCKTFIRFKACDDATAVMLSR